VARDAAGGVGGVEESSMKKKRKKKKKKQNKHRPGFTRELYRSRDVRSSALEAQKAVRSRGEARGGTGKPSSH
jgi:hypothetical protein